MGNRGPGRPTVPTRLALPLKFGISNVKYRAQRPEGGTRGRRRGGDDFAKECLISLHLRPDCLPGFSDQSLLAVDRLL